MEGLMLTLDVQIMGMDWTVLDLGLWNWTWA